MKLWVLLVCCLFGAGCYAMTTSAVTGRPTLVLAGFAFAIVAALALAGFAFAIVAALALGLPGRRS